MSNRSNRRSFGPWIGAVLLLAVALGLAFWGIATRAKSLDVVTKETRELAVPTVAVITPERGAPQQEIVLPGTMQAFADAGIYARVPGYLRKWYVDLGAPVRAGQLMADIDTPDIDQQLEQATRRPGDGGGQRPARAVHRRALPRSRSRPTRCRSRMSTTPTAASRRGTRR